MCRAHARGEAAWHAGGEMSPSRLSYWRTTSVAALLGLLGVGLTVTAALDLRGIAQAVFEVLGSLVGLGGASFALGGVLVLQRSRGLERGQPDLFLRMNAARGPDVVGSGNLGWGTAARRILRRVLRQSYPLVGDQVQVRSLREIHETLDESGCLEGLPFMEEMAAFCGRQARVFRCVDKVFDYGRSWRLRRIEHVVALTGLRCDGSAHGGCQASCSLLWKTAWLKPVPHDSARVEEPRPETPGMRPVSLEHAARSGYTCQFTQLSAASRPLSRWDLRQDLRPLLSGNLTLRAFLVGTLTRVFNRLEKLRGGSGYPPVSRSTRRRTPAPDHSVSPGERVRVLESERIAATLDAASRNRGLTFDREMMKHCGQQFLVSRRIERIIDGGTGQLLAMKTPCLVLDGVDNSGEFLRFWSQHEFLYWREVWLEPETIRKAQGQGRLVPPDHLANESQPAANANRGRPSTPVEPASSADRWH